jgi:hypothetical protein
VVFFRNTVIIEIIECVAPDRSTDRIEFSVDFFIGPPQMQPLQFGGISPNPDQIGSIGELGHRRSSGTIRHRQSYNELPEGSTFVLMGQWSFRGQYALILLFFYILSYAITL